MSLSKRNILVLFQSILVIVIVFLLGAAQLYVLANAFIFFACLFFYFYNKNVVIFVFIVFLPTNGFFSTENNIMGVLSPITISQLFAFIVLLKCYKKDNLSQFARISILVITGLFIYNVIYDFRNAYFEIYDLNFEVAFKRLFKNIFRFGSLFLLIRALDRKLFIDVTIYAIHTGVTLLIASSIFTYELGQMGFLTTDASEVISNSLSIERKSGFFAFGDVNSLGGFLACYFGFLLILFSTSKQSFIFIALTLLTVIGILYTGSRTAIISLISIIIIYPFIKITINKKYNIFKKIFFILTMALVFSLIVNFLPENISLILSRFTESGTELDPTFAGSRIYKWLYYLDYLWKTPEAWILGTRQELFLLLGRDYWQARVPHNFYITILFHAGIGMLCYFLFIWYKLFSLCFNYFALFLILLPIFTISFYVSDWGFFQYFVIFLPLFNDQLSVAPCVRIVVA